MNSSPALPFITVGVGRLGWCRLPCLAVLCTHRDYGHEGCITVPSKGNQKLGVGGDRVSWMWVGAKSLDGGCSFIKHLEDNLPPLSFSSIKNVPCMKKASQPALL